MKCAHCGSTIVNDQIALTPRELSVLRLVVAGKTSREIGGTLYLSEKSIKNILTLLYAQIGATNRASATAWFVRSGLE